MPISHQIDKALGVVFSTAEGVLTAQDILTHRQRIYEDLVFDPSYDELIDLRDVIEFPVSSTEMQKIAELPLFNEKSRRAIVAEKDINFGMARMYEMLHDLEPDLIKVFRDLAEARRWLGLDEATNSN